MSTDQNIHMIWWLLAALLPLSALLSRRISWRGTAAMMLSWTMIFILVLAMFSYRQEFTNIALHIKERVVNESRQRSQGGTLRVAMSDDGHFWVMSRVNGNQVRFLVDSGATITTISDDIAFKSGIKVDEYAPSMAMQTANGVVFAKRSSIDGLSVGPIETKNLPIVVSERMNGVNVLGMNFLSRLKSWRVEDGVMILQP